MRKATLDHLFKHLSPQSKLVMRVDFNVPIKNQKVVDPNRVVSSPSSIKALFLPLNSFLNTNQSLLCYCHIMEGPMVKELSKIHYNLLWDLSKIYLEEEFDF